MSRSVSYSRSTDPSARSVDRRSVESDASTDSSSTSIERSDHEEVAGTFDAGTPRQASAPTQVPLCPAPVKRIIQGLALVAGGAGLAELIYGGIGIASSPDPLQDPLRQAHVVHMIAGVILLGSGLIGFNVARATVASPATESPAPFVNPA